MPLLHDETVDGAGVALHASVGPRNGPPLVLLHGVTRAGRDWDILLPALLPRWTVHAFDQRGHGRSGRATGAYRVTDYADDAVAYVRGLDEAAVVVGHSLGAMVAAAVAARLPDRVHAVALEDPTFEMTGRRIDETGFADLFRAYFPHAGSDRPISEIVAALAAEPVRTPTGERAPLGTIRDAAALRFIAACLRRLDPGVLSIILEGRWLDGYDAADMLRNVACPALFLQADFTAGGALPDEYANELADMIAECSLVKLFGIGHNIHGTQPGAVLRVLLPFLASLSA
jgi:pimeloyl-ACP methyl ester carboxylesterase